MNLFEILSQAQGADAFKALARQYGLSEDQAQSAVQAMMPAFATGLKRNTAAPDGMAGFLRALSGGRHASYFDDPGQALSGGGIADGNAILGHLFGNKEVSRAVAAQAQAATGIGESVLKQMLPAIAAMVMGGLSKESRNSQSAPLLGELLEQLAKGGGGSPKPAGKGPLDRYESEQRDDNPLGELFEQMMGGGMPAGGADNPLGKMFEQMTGGASSSGQAKAPRGEDIFGEMFEPGRQMGEAYQKNMDSIFDQYLSGMNRRR